MELENEVMNTEDTAVQSIDDIMPTLLEDGSSASDVPENEPAGEETTPSEENIQAQGEEAPAEAASESPAGMQNTNVLDALERSLDTLEKKNKENSELQEKVQRLEALLSEQNAAFSENLAEGASSMPDIDFDELAFLSPEERKTRMNDFYKAVFDKTKADVLGELSPIIGEYNKAKAENELSQRYSELAKDPTFADIEASREQIERVLARTPGVEAIPLENRLILGYLASRGIDAANAPEAPERTAADIAKEAMANPEVMKLIAEAHAGEVMKAQSFVPPSAPSHGYANAPVTLTKKPQSIDEVTKNLFNTLGK
jgi:hypothetical protein